MARLLVQCLEFLELVEKLEVLVSRPNEGIRPSLGLAMARNLGIDRCNGRLTALRGANGPQWAMIPEADWTSPLLERGKVTNMVSLLRVYNYSGLPHSIISEVLRKWWRHLPYDLANVKG